MLRLWERGREAIVSFFARPGCPISRLCGYSHQPQPSPPLVGPPVQAPVECVSCVRPALSKLSRKGCSELRRWAPQPVRSSDQRLPPVASWLCAQHPGPRTSRCAYATPTKPASTTLPTAMSHDSHRASQPLTILLASSGSGRNRHRPTNTRQTCQGVCHVTGWHTCL